MEDLNKGNGALKTPVKVALGIFLVLIAAVGVVGFIMFQEITKAKSDDPSVYNEDIAELVAATKGRGPLNEAVLFVGSSSIRLWSTLAEDMAPLVTIRHGFGGAKLADVEHFAEPLVADFAPRAIVVFAGTNDIHPGDTKRPEDLLAIYRSFVARVRAELADVPIYYIGITPSPLRFLVWDVARETNSLIEAFTEESETLHYIETGPRLLGPDGTPNPDNYRFDGLHLSDRGYAIWTEIIRSRLMQDLRDPAS